MSDQQSDELREVFMKICDPNDWKAPIDKVIDKPTPMELFRMSEAVIYFTASDLVARDLGNNKIRIRSAGYCA